ncbi:uncharacterized protein TRAVEDRAFT_28005 [Trametes versicolor FP-101664 SS1]|uniref:uncharacterized protein n=1 Tax=Trametes versicolor (strain FP-101664) TaxID=717944 RepID=UPI0004623375|nr:uncharacterized protein TRAVEDRAFT_28005 [Trametes versicolor FP-101664 SS1]EIW60428.1 hypothetical protein TRAVEDRAFT_28005 [Trametes versicolor FP-101664 SS1]
MRTSQALRPQRFQPPASGRCSFTISAALSHCRFATAGFPQARRPRSDLCEPPVAVRSPELAISGNPSEPLLNSQHASRPAYCLHHSSAVFCTAPRCTAGARMCR